MRDIYQLIDKISSRTPMYIGEAKLSNLRSFLDGYTFSLDQESKSQFMSNFGGFHDWVAKKYGFKESTAGYQNMILAMIMGLSPQGFNWNGLSNRATEYQHKQSLLKFFELVKEYKNA